MENKSKIGILAASGLGDGLLMQIAAHQFQGTLYSDCSALSELFNNVKPWPDAFTDFDLLIVENDNSARCWDLMKRRNEFKSIRFIFPTINPRLDIRDEDFVCNPKLAMAENIANACAKWLNSTPTKENGIWKPPPAHYQIVKQRVCIHPTSRDPKRNWSRSSFEALAKALSWRGYFPAFLVDPQERDDWKWVQESGFCLPLLTGMKELAQFIFESGYLIGNDSGLGHLASNLGIPTLTISGNPKRVQLWRPAFIPGSIVTLKVPLPNFKGVGLKVRDNCWQPFVSLARVLKQFERQVK
ncbi:MAG: hypothetical protein KDK44_00425 [Chlamydiia bacterium]|nr:hypothetical protein [Chlamydiia bacterium]MCP5510091.1 hypothetical protein [Chlamydiales bacterium]